MSIIRVVHNRENPYVQLNKEALWNENLSLKATGLWARCMSRPDNWRFVVSELVSKCKEGRRAIDSAIQELIQNRYAMKVEHWEKDEKGHFTKGGVEYIFFEFPATDEEIKHHQEEFKKSFRLCGFGNRRNGNLQNDELLKKESLNPIKSLEKEEEREYVAQSGKKAQTPSAPRHKSCDISFSHEKREFQNIAPQDWKDWKDLYNAVNLELQFKDMTQWILSNPSRVKGRTRWRKFINNWLRKQQDKVVNKMAYQQQRKADVLSRHTGLQQDHSPRDPRKVIDFSGEE